jgi:hypothetical protein
MKFIIPNLQYNINDSGICHMMLFNKNLLNQLFETIEKIHKKPVWQVCLDSVIEIVIYLYSFEK